MTELHRFACGSALALVLGACGFEHGEIPITDAPVATLTVSFGGPATMTDEASGTVTIPVVLSGVSLDPVSVGYTIASGSTATRPDDFMLSDGTVTFMPGQTHQAIPVTIEMDSLEEPDEMFTVELTHPVGASLGAMVSHTVTISSDILPRAAFADPTPSTAAEASSPQVEITLTLPPKDVVSVALGVAGTASAADRGVTDGQVVTFQAGQISAIVPLDVVQDQLDEDDETIDLTLTNPTGKLLLAATGIARSHTITDDDPMPTVGFAVATSMTAENAAIDLTVQLSAPSGRMVSVGYAVTGGTAAASDATVTGAPGVITFMPGQTAKTIAVTPTNDAIDEPNETVTVGLGTPSNATLAAITSHTVTINDDDDPPSVSFTQATASANEVAATVNLTVQLSGPSSFDVTMPFSVAGTSTANNPEDFTLPATSSVMIPAGMTSATIPISVKADTLDEANETVIVDLGTPTNATLGAVASETLTINDDDPAPTVAFTSMGSAPNENNANVTLTVQLSDISGQDVTIPYTIDAASTAVNPADYTISPPSPLVIPAGQTSTTITIAMKEDTLDEADETVIVVLGAATNATLGSPSTYTFTIRDDDQPPNVSWNPAESDLAEPEGTNAGNQTRSVTYTMVLSAPSGQTVTVPISYTGTATAGTDYTGPASVSFAPGATTTNVTLAIVKDSTPEPGPAETIIMTIDAMNVTNAGTQMPLVRTYSIQDDD